MKASDLNEKWSQKYKDSINCSNPKGFSQKAHCAGKKKTSEEVMYKGKPYKSGNYGTGSAGANPPVYKDKRYKSGDARNNPSDYKGKPYRSGDAGKSKRSSLESRLREAVQKTDYTQLLKLYNEGMRMMPGTEEFKNIQTEIGQLRQRLQLDEQQQARIDRLDEIWPAIARTAAAGVGAAAKWIAKGSNKIANKANKIANPPKPKADVPDLKLDPLPRNRPGNPYWKDERNLK